MHDEVIRNRVFPMLTALIIIMTISAYTVSRALAGSLGVTAQSVSLAILTNPLGVFLITVIYFVFFIIAYATARVRIVNVITSSLFALVMGAGIFGMIFFFADLINAQILPEALLLTAGLFTISVIFQFVTKKNLSHWTWWVVFILLVALGLTFAEFFVQASLFRIGVDLAVVLIFTLIVMYDTYIIREKLTDDQWMIGVLEFFLDFANILIRVILILIQIFAEQ